MTDLFRKEVLQRQGERLLGDVVLASPISHVAMLALLVAIVMCLVAFSILGEFARKERVTGYLVPDRGLIRLLPVRAGLIEAVDVGVGTAVDKGDRLFVIKTDTRSGHGQETAGTLLGQLAAERADLERQAALVAERFSLDERRLRARILATSAERERLTDRIALQQRAVDNERVALEKFRRLSGPGTVTAFDVLQRENRYLETEQSLGELRNEHQQLADRIADLDARLEMLPISRQQAQGDLRGRLNAVEQRTTEIRGQQRYVVTAPIAGRIASLTAKKGQPADVRRALATLLPTGGKLEAELLVPSRAAGFVTEGQVVRLLYDAFPYQKFGTYPGTIARVSRTVISPTDLPTVHNVLQPVFVVTVALDRQAIEANGQVYGLQAGMTLAADIILEDRKVWQWALEPVLRASRN